MNTIRYIFAILFLQAAVNILAQQTTWEYVLRTPELDEESIDLIEGNDGSIFVGGRTIMLEQQYNYKSLLLKIDPQGTFVDSVHFTIPGKWTSMSQILPVSNDNYVVLSTFRDLNPPHKNCGLHMQLMNGNLEITNQITILADSSYRINGSWGHYSVYDGNLFINLSVILQVGFYHSYLFEIDSNFNIIKQKFLTDYPKAYSHLKKLDDNTYWALNLYTNKYEIFDSAFNLVGEQKVPERMTANFGVKWDSDTSFYLMGDHMPGNYHNLGFLRQPHYFDTTGYLFNSWGEADTLDFPAWSNGIDFRNKDSIFIGGTHNMPYALDPGQQPVPTWFVILQTDSLLNVRWERFYGGNANYLMMNLIATRDGGCLVAGTRYDYMNSPEQQTDIIMLKLNSEGLLVGNNELPETRMHEAIVYPNPGTDALQIRLAVQHPTALLELFDANGRLVLSQQLYQKESRIAVDHLPSGTYIYRLSADTGLLENGKWVKQ
jgi:hypothetical protein